MASAPQFIGRQEHSARFRARLNHFRVFLYEGIAGIGKTALALHLAAQAQSTERSRLLFVATHPGETVGALATRLHARLGPLPAGDPVLALPGGLDAAGVVLMLDNAHHLQRDELGTLVRALTRSKTARFRVLITVRGEANLAALDRAALHIERLGALSTSDVLALAERCGVPAAQRDEVAADAARGGALAHPLTARWTFALCAQDLPEKSFLAAQKARSAHAFAAFWPLLRAQLRPPTHDALAALAQVGAPLAVDVAEHLFGAPLREAAAAGLVDVIDGALHLHETVGNLLPTATLPQQQARPIAAALAKGGDARLALRAAEVLAHAGCLDEAVALLTEHGALASDSSLSEAFLKTLAALPAAGAAAGKLELLAAQARLRQGHGGAVLADLGRLATDADPWTRANAQLAQARHFAAEGAHAQVIALHEKCVGLPEFDAATRLQFGALAAQALLATSRLDEAEKLCQSLLALPQHPDEGAARAHLWLVSGRLAGLSGRLEAAIEAMRQAAAAFGAAGDADEQARALGLCGDLLREAGEFAGARDAFAEFRQAAALSGDRNLVAIAELSDAWVSLDIGDVARAAKKIALLHKEGMPPQGRLKRHLDTAAALLEAGRGHHDKASELLRTAVQAWQQVGEGSQAEPLQAQLVRSLIACDRIDEAEAAIGVALQGLDVKTAAPQVAALLRERALVHLRRDDAPRALAELDEACRLFQQSGRRRDEALTLHRLAHAALEENNLQLACDKAQEALELGTRIGHPRAGALAHELLARVALLRDDATAACDHAAQALATFRELGDSLGVAHAAEIGVAAHLLAGDVAAAGKLAERLRRDAAQLDVIELRARALAWLGVVALRHGDAEAAGRDFRELSDNHAPWSRALMYRFGEAAALRGGDVAEAGRRRAAWVRALQQLPTRRRTATVHALVQLALPPADRCELRTASARRLLTTEEMALVTPSQHSVLIDVLYRRLSVNGALVRDLPVATVKLLMRLAAAYPHTVPLAKCLEALGEPLPAKGLEARLRSLHKSLRKALAQVTAIDLHAAEGGLALSLPADYAVLLPVWMVRPVSEDGRHILKLLRKSGLAGLGVIQETCQLSRATARRELDELARQHLVQVVRDGRGQVYRLT